MNVQKLKEKRGITLVVLVVTIVILLILSGVSIRTLSGESGLITKTKIAKEENQKAEYKESMKPYLIGALLLFTGTLIPQIIYEFSKGI